MKKAASILDFERAAELRDILIELREEKGLEINDAKLKELGLQLNSSDEQ